MTAKFTKEQPPVRMVNIGNGYYTVYICVNPREIVEKNSSDYSSIPSEEVYIEYDYNEFKEQVDVLNVDDINMHPEKYLNYKPDAEINKYTLDEYKNKKQEENKVALANFLNNQFVTYKGKHYGVSEEDQNEMALNLLQYNSLVSVGQECYLEWHSKKAQCESFSLEEYIELTALIKSFVYPYYQQMQKIKEQIFLCSTKWEVSLIEIYYECMNDRKNGDI